MGWSNNYHGIMQYDDDYVLSFPASVDFQAENYSVNDVPILDEMFLNDDPFYWSPQNHLHDTNFVIPPAEFWNEFMEGEDESKYNNVNINNTSDWALEMEKEKKKVAGRKRRRGVDYNSAVMMSSKKLSRETISKYFYMTITQAARELNVGLTLLKKRCRELGIRRWPQRKLNSLQTLIKNVQEFRNEVGSESLKENLQILEQEKKLLEEIPDMQLDHTTKRLRQAFFKANYKKRKLIRGMLDSPPIIQSQASSSSTTTVPTASISTADHANVAFTINSYGVDVDAEDEELKYLLADCFSCTL